MTTHSSAAAVANLVKKEAATHKANLAAVTLKALFEDFAEHGPEVIGQVRAQSPEKYLAICASTFPKDPATSGATGFNELIKALERIANTSRVGKKSLPMGPEPVDVRPAGDEGDPSGPVAEGSA